MQENKQEKSPIKQNILLYLEEKGVTPYEFYKLSGVTRGVLAQNNGISEDNISKFLAYATDVNPSWLLTGEGEMLIKDGSVEQNDIVGDSINGHNVTVGKSGDDYMKVIMQQSLQLSKSQEQIDRLITLLEKMSDKKE